MTDTPFRITPLGKEDRSGFHCGSAPLDRYFVSQAGQDVRRRMTACFIAINRATDIIAGYYTLSAADIPATDVPEELTRRLPRYPTIPAARLGRLAVDERFRGAGLGGALLSDAIERAGRTEIAVHAMVVEAKDENAAAFYRHHGFATYGSAPRMLIAPLHTLLKAGK